MNYLQFFGIVMDGFQNETRNLATASKAFKAGNVAAFKTAATEGREKMHELLIECESKNPPQAFTGANSHLIQALSLAVEGFTHRENFAESNDESKRQMAVSTIDSAVSQLKQASDENMQVLRADL